jgi:hypothetical protein
MPEAPRQGESTAAKMTEAMVSEQSELPTAKRHQLGESIVSGCATAEITKFETTFKATNERQTAASSTHSFFKSSLLLVAVDAINQITACATLLQ